jgi:hypothetical protein
MAATLKRTDPPPIDEVPRFDTLPEVREVAELRALLSGGVTRIELEILISKLHYGIRQIPSSPTRLEDSKLLLARKAGELAALGGPVDILALVTRALEILQDDQVLFELTPNNRRADLERALPIVEGAAGITKTRHETLRSNCSRDVAERLAPQHGALLVALYRSAQTLSVAGERERSFRARLQELGYTVPSYLLPMPATLGAVLALGVEYDQRSQLAAFRRFLEGRELL